MRVQRCQNRSRRWYLTFSVHLLIFFFGFTGIGGCSITGMVNQYTNTCAWLAPNHLPVSVVVSFPHILYIVCQRTIILYSLCTKIICLFTARWHFSMYEHFFPWIDSSLWPNWTTIRFCSCSIFLGSMYKIHVICLSTATFWTSYPIFWHFLFVTRIYLVCGQLNTIDFVYSGVKRNAK